MARTRFKAVKEMPSRMDLWISVCALCPAADGPELARAFYDARKADMDKGAVVSWPTFRPLYTLMCKRAEDRAAFDAEQQNDPLATDAAPFAAAIFYWRELPPELLLFGAVIPLWQGRTGARSIGAAGGRPGARKHAPLCPGSPDPQAPP